MSASYRNFRWAYKLLIAFSKLLLVQKNILREHEEDWPRGMKFYEMVGTSHSMLFHEARNLAGIVNDEFIAAMNAGDYDVDDIYEMAQVKEPEHPLERAFRFLKGQVKLADDSAKRHQQAYELQHADANLLYHVLAEYAPKEVMDVVLEKMHGLGQEWDKVDSVYLRLKQDRADLIRTLKAFMDAWGANESCDAAYDDAFYLLERMGEIE